MRIPAKILDFLHQPENKPLYLQHGQLDEFYTAELFNLISEGAEYITDPALSEWFSTILADQVKTQVLITQLQDYHYTNEVVETLSAMAMI